MVAAQELKLIDYKKDKPLIRVFLLVQLAILANMLVVKAYGDVVSIFWALFFVSIYSRSELYLFYSMITGIFSTQLYSGNFPWGEMSDSDSLTAATDLVNGCGYALIIQLIRKNLINRQTLKEHISQYLLVFMAYIAVHSFTMAVYKDVAISNFIRTLSFFILFVCTTTMINNMQNFINLLKLFGYFAIFTSVMTVIKFIYASDERYYGGSPLLLCLPLMLNVFSYNMHIAPGKLNRGRAIILILTVLSVLSIFQQASRRTLIAIGIIMVSFFFSISRRVGIAGVLAVAIPILYLAYANLPETLKQRLEISQEALQEYENTGAITQNADVFYNERDELFAAGWELFLENPLFGSGYYNSPEFMEIMLGEKHRIHNFYLQILSELGVVGMVLYLWIFIRLFGILIKVYKRTQDNTLLFLRYQSYALMVYLVTVSIISFFGMHLIYGKFEWFVYGLVVALGNISDKQIRELT